jgi:cell shape-determining protein MreC
MSYLKFNHVFFGLMALSLLSAFVLPARVTDRAGSSVANIFLPISAPSRRLAAWAHSKLVPRPIRDDGSPGNPRSVQKVYDENELMRIELGSLKEQLLRLQERESERSAVGEVRALCTPFTVAAGDSAGRDSLALSGSSFDGVAAGQPVLYPGGIAGKISRAGIGEARVMLVTDTQFSAEVTFARFLYTDGHPDLRSLSSEKYVLHGSGRGSMFTTVSSSFMEETHLVAGDWAVLSDNEWGLAVRGYRIGQVSAVAPSKSAGWFDVTIKPDQDLKKLDEVMVLNRKG